MIQRIQTVYLLFVAFIMIATLFFPLGFIISDADSTLTTFDMFGIHGESELVRWPLFALPICSILLAVITIFYYNKRKLQVNLSYLTILLIVLIYILGGIFLRDLIQTNTASFSFTCILPLVALVFEILAILRIKKDIRILRSGDRIRP